jgi:phytoene dehydrogenase-like protein
VDVPKPSLLTKPYVVRLADGTDVRLREGDAFLDELSSAFPECGDQAIAFYREPRLEHLKAASPRFQSFIDGQLRAFLHASIDQCDFASAIATLQRVRGPLYEIEGGPATLAERLAESIGKSGGTVRLNTPVLRLAYDTSGAAAGVDLLSGETVAARRAIVSNLTIWDTYGKLIGLNRTPAEIKKQLSMLHGTGVYVVYASIEETAVARLPAERMRVEDGEGEFTLAISSSAIAPEGKRGVTFTTRTEIDSWFAYQSSEEDYEEWDQEALEQFWKRLHAALPELGGDIEIIETANPRTYYDSTRRKLGMVLGVNEAVSVGHATSLPNVFMVGDTVTDEAKVDTVVQSAILLATIVIRQD